MNFCFCKLLSLLDQRIYFCLKTARSWLELKIKFNRYSMRSFQRTLVGFNNIWIHFIFREFNYVSVSKIPSPPLQIKSWAGCLGGRIFSFPFFQFLFWYISKFDLCTIVRIRGFGLQFSFYLFQIWIFYYSFIYFDPTGVIEDRVTKINYRYFNRKLWLFHLSWLINSIFKCSSP